MADLQVVLLNIRDSFPGVYTLVWSGSKLIGLAFIVKAIYQLKAYGDLRTMMSVQTDFRGPMVMIFVGTLLWFLPSSLEVAMNTVFGYENPLRYQGSDDPSRDLAFRVVGDFVQLVGFIAFIRGWTLVVQVTKQGAPHGTSGKALTHILGGIVAMNIWGTLDVLGNTVGLDIGLRAGGG